VGIECAVLIVPERFDFPSRNVLAYDGSKESVYAIKQFAYLFPELTDAETLLVYANDDAEKDFPDKAQIEELAARHFPKLSMFKLDINPKRFFTLWASEEKSAMLVSGSYGHSGLSQLFKQSFVKDVITDHKVPVFIAHR
jgi:nucleotide-binding universal stress UspA family protein